MKVRTFSAVVAVALLVGLYLGLGQNGLLLISSFGVLIATIEFIKMTISRIESYFHLKAVFLIFTMAIFASTVYSELAALPALAISSVSFLTMTLLTVRTNEDLPNIFKIQSMGLLGFLYCGLFAGLAVRLLHFENGTVWLFGLMAIVFSGDTFAYLTGRLLGRRLLLEPVSPKKTIEGSVGGLIGSGIAGSILGIFYFPDLPLPSMILMALTTGAFAQVGDLFESLVKRVAEVKDSGGIMPGHGGILDRIDGILFAAPIFYILVNFIN